ncbi:MAG: hypothetical protein WCT32_02715 [Patescibacteria group bacterium]|jgi:hypothetical protein
MTEKTYTEKMDDLAYEIFSLILTAQARLCLHEADQIAGMQVPCGKGTATGDISWRENEPYCEVRFRHQIRTGSCSVIIRIGGSPKDVHWSASYSERTKTGEFIRQYIEYDAVSCELRGYKTGRLAEEPGAWLDDSRNDDDVHWRTTFCPEAEQRALHDLEAILDDLKAKRGQWVIQRLATM